MYNFLCFFVVATNISGNLALKACWLFDSFMTLNKLWTLDTGHNYGFTMFSAI